MLRTRAGTSLPLLEGLYRSQNSNGDAESPTGILKFPLGCEESNRGAKTGTGVLKLELGC